MVQPFRIGVDTGGTFTDVVLLPPDGGAPVVHKLLSTPDDPSRAVLEGIAAVLEKVGADGVRPQQEGQTPSDPTVKHALQIIHGSTVATNALLEGKGGRVAFVATAGFEDLLWLRRQNRPELYALEPVVPQPPLRQQDCFGAKERIAADSAILQDLGVTELERLESWLRGLGAQASTLHGSGNAAKMAALPVSAVAICLLHSYANPAHEQRIAAMLRELFPHLHLTASSDLLPEFREYERAATCLVNAACAAPMVGYLSKLGQKLAGAGPSVGPLATTVTIGHEGSPLWSELRIMGSHGGTIPVQAVAAVPARTVLSGPAGGVLGAVTAAKAAGVTRFLSYDMGGTSTDVALCNGIPSMTQASEIAGLPLKLPMLDIHTVGAGGGSIAWVDAGGMLRVGPQSLGADPGPACYGRQTAPLVPSVTDAHVVLGHIPAGTKLGGSLAVDREAARTAVRTIAEQLGLGIEEAAAGILRVATAEVARALRRMSVERGEDPRDYCLLPFGGMGGLHAAELAEQLGMQQILLPPHPGILSALGMLSAPVKDLYSQSVLLETEAAALPERVEQAIGQLTQSANAALEADGVAAGQRRFDWSLDLRYRGQSHEVNVSFRDTQLGGALSAFEAEHQRLYGYVPVDAEVELVALRLEASGPQTMAGQAQLETKGEEIEVERAFTTIWDEGLWKEWAAVQRGDLGAGDELSGPALLAEYSATSLIPEGWSGRVLPTGATLLFRQQTIVKGTQEAALMTRAPQQVELVLGALHDPVTLSIFRHLYASIAEEMGSRLMRSAFSPNIKERRDFSCALLLADGQMLAQAAHVPVHLGSMPLSVAAVLERFPADQMQAGDVFVVNDPFAGGTHLPDITVVAPVFIAPHPLPQFLVANRAHHADIGGISPGSMPLSRSIDEEGIRLEPQRLDAACLEGICVASRTSEERRGDLQAQLAALALGQERLAELVKAHELETCLRHAAELIDYSERCMREALKAVPCGQGEFTDYLDDDGFGGTNIKLHCELTIEDGKAIVDLRGCDPQVAGPMNAVHAIAVSAALYCFRCLAQRLLPDVDIPENAGLLRPVTVLTQPGTIADALPPSAVAAGNVETSQRLVDVIFGAVAQLLPDLMPAASGGSMNNVTIGNDRFAYYETLACGAGGGPQGAGASAVHTHMTNTLNTPVEALEHAFPLRVLRYGLRRGSGGTGQHAGGDGIVRRYRAVEPCTATLLTERRTHRPWGVGGGSPGMRGTNTLYRADGTLEHLGGKASVQLQPGDELEIATPGGGGWGATWPATQPLA